MHTMRQKVRRNYERRFQKAHEKQAGLSGYGGQAVEGKRIELGEAQKIPEYIVAGCIRGLI
jgi:hypothetical protein